MFRSKNSYDFFEMVVNYEPEGMGGAGGQGGGQGGQGGQGGGQGQGEGQGSGEFDPSVFKNEMQDFVVRAVNGAISTHLNRSLDSRLQENNQGLMNSFKELLSESLPKAQGENGGKTQSGNPDVDTAIKNATAPLIKQLEEQKRLNEQAAARAKQAEEERLHNEKTTSLSQTLINQGVPAPLAQAAVHTIHDRVKRDDKGKMYYVAEETGPTGPYEEHVSIEEGIKRWLSTENGKHFLPARQVGGSGNQGGRSPQGKPNAGSMSDGEFLANVLTGNIP